MKRITILILVLVLVCILSISLIGCKSQETDVESSQFYSFRYHTEMNKPIIVIEDELTYDIQINCEYVKNNSNDTAVWFIDEIIDLCKIVFPNLWIYEDNWNYNGGLYINDS